MKTRAMATECTNRARRQGAVNWYNRFGLNRSKITAEVRKGPPERSAARRATSGTCEEGV